MKILLPILICFTTAAIAQQNKKATKNTLIALQKHIDYLASNKLEGRRTGTAGEKLAYEYIEQEFKKIGLQYFNNTKTFIQPFTVQEGKQMDSSSTVLVNNVGLKINTDFFYFPFSANAASLKVDLNTAYKNQCIFIQKVLDSTKDNPHFDIYDFIYNKTVSLQHEGAKFLLIINSDNGLGIKASQYADLNFDEKDKHPKVNIPVLYLTKEANNALKVKANSPIEITMQCSVAQKVKTGHNVVGYVNNNADNTIVLGAHYDHLGYGEDHNSLYTGSIPAIHNGADDNASGTAALIEIAKILKQGEYKKNNYLFVSFSGEELGLFGSKFFVDSSGMQPQKINYMINMDMVGRLSDSTHGLTIGGYGTSPTWGTLITSTDTYFKIHVDSSGSGPSDHTSFYRKNIPVLFFFTGSHKDYHKPTDDADKINYTGELAIIEYIKNIIAKTNNLPKLAFTKTRETSMGKSSFKVSLGIMPDYTFAGNGVMVDGVSENRPAQKAGIKTGDVIMQLGDYKCTDVQTYMDALNKFNKGQSTNVLLKRKNEELLLPITF